MESSLAGDWRLLGFRVTGNRQRVTCSFVIEILHIAECPTWEATRDLVERVTGEPVAARLVSSPEEAEALGFTGSPTVLVDGVDPWGDHQTSRVGLACRIYRLPDGGLAGGPTEAMVRLVLS